MHDILIGIFHIVRIGFIASIGGIIYASATHKDKKPFLKALVVCIVAGVIVSGGLVATYPKKDQQSQSNTPQSMQPSTQPSQTKDEKKDTPATTNPKPTNANLDFYKAIEETKKEFANQDFYPLVKDTTFKVNESEHKIIIAAVVNNAMNEKSAKELADSLIRRFSSNMVLHNSQLTTPQFKNYGSLFDQYDLQIGVAPSSQIDNPNKWLVHDFIIKGTHKLINR